MMNGQRSDLPHEVGDRDLVIPPQSYAYVQGVQNGIIRVLVGPTMITISGQDRPIRYDPANREWTPCPQEPKSAVRKFISAKEGEYIILENPSKMGNHPPEGGSHPTPSDGLKMGEKVVINGPATFALWPGQVAETRPGHHLLSSQFLRVRVYNEEAAKTNWKDAAERIGVEDLKLGQILIIKGTEESFFIPPTGIEVLHGSNGEYVQEAVTLERLEYCILVDENGKKRYERGPAVVFPEPTEKFVTDDEGARKFKAIELTPMSGLHIKVIEDYTEGGKAYKAGDEMFITGRDVAIYFPRAEHSIIKYGPREKHYASAVPVGEGRYVLDRNTGIITTIKGPKMLLPNPTSEVIVRRILTDTECGLWYPSNGEALQYNRQLRQSETADQGYVAESSAAAFSNALADMESSELLYSRGLDAASAGGFRDRAREAVGKAKIADAFSRSQTYTPPRSITLNTKFDGVPRIDVWTGYAVLVVSKDGKRRVEVGPTSILLDYDETIEVLELSTGKPKSTDKLVKTVFLRVKNNKVSDIVDVETSDHVNVKIKISLLVNFEGDPDKWFESDNYVKLLCDHVRSVLKGCVQKKTIEDLWANHVPIVRDAILGASTEGKRTGMVFAENGMVVRDVEVLGFEIQNAKIADQLFNAQFDAVTSNITMQAAKRKLEAQLATEEINRKLAAATSESRMHALKLQTDEMTRRHEHEVAQENARHALLGIQQTNHGAEAEQEKLVNTAQEEASSVEHEFNLKRSKERSDQEQQIEAAKVEIFKTRLAAEVDATVKRFNAAKDGFAEALTAINRDEVLTKVAEAWSVQRMIGGDSFVDAFNKAFAGTPLAGMAENFTKLIARTPAKT